jgi:hypothetical protein
VVQVADTSNDHREWAVQVFGVDQLRQDIHKVAILHTTIKDIQHRALVELPDILADIEVRMVKTE